jgi:hypothetical protein
MSPGCPSAAAGAGAGAHQPHDPNAILVRDSSGAALGYVAREVARNIAPLLDLGETEEVRVRARLVMRKGSDPEQPGTATIALSLTSRT